ncbi:MAG: hypothetical protein ACR2PI_19065 [Hyphomicrobiaceae bacterium]
MNDSAATERSTSADDRVPRLKSFFLRWLSEDNLLRLVFRALVTAAVVFIALDFRQIYEEANAPLPGQVKQTEPVVMQPPRRQDQLRPYLPRATPIHRSGKEARLPGYAKPVPHTAVGKPMTFVRGPNGAASAVGRIEKGTGAQFAGFVEAQSGELKKLYLHSPGGSVRDALMMARLLRRNAIDTVVPQDAYCASSCPIVFSGGKRRVAGKRAWIGVHQIYAAASTPGGINDGMAHAQAISGQVQEHLDKMGIDPAAWIHAMKTPSDQLYVFTRKELETYRFVSQK